MTWTLQPIVTDERFEQPEKAKPSISVTESGMTTLLRLEQPPKEFQPIDFNELLSLTDIRFVQPLNPFQSISVTVSGMTILVILVQFENAYCHISVTGHPEITEGITTSPPGPLYPDIVTVPPSLMEYSKSEAGDSMPLCSGLLPAMLPDISMNTVGTFWTAAGARVGSALGLGTALGLGLGVMVGLGLGLTLGLGLGSTLGLGLGSTLGLGLSSALGLGLGSVGLGLGSALGLGSTLGTTLGEGPSPAVGGSVSGSVSARASVSTEQEKTIIKHNKKETTR